MNRRDAIKGIGGMALGSAEALTIAAQPRELTLEQLLAWAKENKLSGRIYSDGEATIWCCVPDGLCIPSVEGENLLDALRRAHNGLGK